jgi:hypothetical protein
LDGKNNPIRNKSSTSSLAVIFVGPDVSEAIDATADVVVVPRITVVHRPNIDNTSGDDNTTNALLGLIFDFDITDRTIRNVAIMTSDTIRSSMASTAFIA